MARPVYDALQPVNVSILMFSLIQLENLVSLIYLFYYKSVSTPHPLRVCTHTSAVKLSVSCKVPDLKLIISFGGK